MNKYRLIFKIIAPLLAFSMLSTVASANSDNCLSIKRELENNVVSGRMYVGENLRFTPVTIKVTNEESKVIYLDHVYVGEDGNAVFEYVHNIQNAGTGIMTVTAYHNSLTEMSSSTYKVVDPEVIDALVSAIQAECKKETPDDTVIKHSYFGTDSDGNGIADNAEIFNLDLTLYNTISDNDEVFEILANDPENDSIDTMDKAVQAFYDAVALEKIISGSDTSVVTELMSSDLYSTIFKKELLPINSDGKCVLDAATETVRTKIYEQIVSDKTTSKQILADNLALYTLTKSLEFGAWQNIPALLESYVKADYLDIDYSVYNTLKNKTAVDKAMSGKFESYASIENAFETSAKNQKKKEQNTTTSPGGSGGGGGGGISVSISKDYNDRADDKEDVSSGISDNAENTGVFGIPVFEDMEEAKWAIEAVEALHRKGIINGTGENRFEPNRGITRAEFVKLLTQMAGLSPISEDVFNDVNSQHWSYPYAAAAYKAGLAIGDDNKNFNGDKIINREEMAVMVVRLMNTLNIAPKENDTSAFDDSDEISEWALDSVTYLKNVEIINGRSKNFFEPKTTLTRAEAAVVIYKVLNKA